jgi:hypothetical protein
MSLRFWRKRPRRSESSTASNTADNSAIAGESAPPASLDRKAARNSRLEIIAVLSVVAGIVAEDWDEFFKFAHNPNWTDGRIAVGGAVVVLGIISEIWFSSRSASAEREIRDWYALRVAELNLKAEQERLARVEIEERIQPRRLSIEQQKAITEALRRFKGSIRPIVVGSSDAESLGLAKQIIAVLRFTGLEVRDASRNIAHIFSPDSGVRVIRYHPEDEDLASTLANALESIGDVKGVNLIRAEQTISDPNAPAWASGIRVIIEPKPVPVIEEVRVIQE